MILRLLNPQGIVGIAISLSLALLLVLQKGETRHWRKQSGQYEQLYRGEQSAFATTVANYRAAADAARAADRAAAERVAAEQSAINQRSKSDYETRLADARARAAELASGRLHLESGGPASDPGRGGAALMPSLSAAPGGAAQAAGQDRLPQSVKELDWRLTATEQAIQLDELINWVKRQAAIDPNASAKPPR